MEAIKVQTVSGSAVCVSAPMKIEVKKAETDGEKQLKLALRVSKLEHTYSVAQRLGIYPA